MLVAAHQQAEISQRRWDVKFELHTSILTYFLDLLGNFNLAPSAKS
jgi:hypothetical protein